MEEEKNIPVLLERNIFSIYTKVATASSRKHFESDYLSWTDVRPSGWPNFLFDLDTSIGIEKIIDLVMMEISEGRAPESIFLGPGSYSEDIDRALVDKGFHQVDKYPGMVFDLEVSELPDIKDSGLKIRKVDSRRDLADFASIVQEGMFGKGFEGVQLLGGLLDLEDFIFLLGSYKDVPVATSLIFFARGIAGIKLVTTRPGHRKKGFASSMMLGSLLQIRKRGSHRAGLFASKMGEGIYRRLGFRHVCDFYKFE